MKSFEQLRTQQSFAELKLENVLNSTLHIEGRPARPTLSPSSFGCYRGAAFKLCGLTPKDSIETYETCLAADMGSFIHGRFQRFMSASDI